MSAEGHHILLDRDRPGQSGDQLIKLFRSLISSENEKGLTNSAYTLIFHLAQALRVSVNVND